MRRINSISYLYVSGGADLCGIALPRVHLSRCCAEIVRDCADARDFLPRRGTTLTLAAPWHRNEKGLSFGQAFFLRWLRGQDLNL